MRALRRKDYVYPFILIEIRSIYSYFKIVKIFPKLWAGIGRFIKADRLLVNEDNECYKTASLAYSDNFE